MNVITKTMRAPTGTSSKRARLRSRAAHPAIALDARRADPELTRRQG